MTRHRARHLNLVFGSVAALCALASDGLAQTTAASSDPLVAGFRDPPNSARPRVWWHWMNGNVTKDGIQKDMEWMSRVGIGGLQNFDAALATPQVVEHRLSYMSPEWKDAFRFSAGLADRLGLELAIAASPGWSETGGPWVPPTDGIKKLVWSETTISGGRPFTGVLNAPPSNTGPFADAAGLSALATQGEAPKPQHYEDIAVVALPVEARPPLPVPRMTGGGGELDTRLLTDGRFGQSLDLRREVPDGEAGLLIEYPGPQTIRSATVARKPAGRSVISVADLLTVLEAETAPGAWRKVADLPMVGDVPTTVSFAPVTAARYRVRFVPLKVPTTAERLGAAEGVVTDTYRPSTPATVVSLAELRLSNEAKVDRFEAKAGFAVVPDYYHLEAAGPGDEPGIRGDAIIDLTSRLRPDGRLDWTPPPGRWKVLRLGWSLTGTTNHPATAEATGLEVDKLDKAAVGRYMDTYLGMFRDTVGPELFGARGLRAILTDSIEVGAFNWTPALPRKFAELRGYDLTPWLPALTGEILGSRAETDRFLYDFRRTIGDLVASEHYGGVAEAAHRQGLKVYGEALEAGRPTLGDDMTLRSHADIPMAAMWTYRPEAGPRPVFLADIKGGASVAHVYGQNLVAAESLTSGLNYWAHAPSDLKPVIDLEFAYGVNRPVIHTSVHQPLDDKKPGLSLLVFGQFFNRHETWAEMAKPWVDYMSRSAFMLQQGRYFADVAYFFGEEAPLTGLYLDHQPADAPKAYGYDFLNPDALQNHVRVEGGRLVADGGTSYRAIYLGGSSRKMTVPTLRRLRDLVAAGATVIGPAPTASPALTDDPKAFAALVGELWSGGPKTRVGAGQMIASQEVDATLGGLGLKPDFQVANAPDSNILFLHRRLTDGDAYFLSNHHAQGESLEARFRVTGRRPEIWRADTGVSEPVSYRTDGDQTVVQLEMLPQDAFFVVFRDKTDQPSRSVARPEWQRVASVDGRWRLAFQPGRGAPASAEADALKSLTEFSDPGIRYFSGVTTYRTTFQAPKGYKAGAPLSLDLGQVASVAEVVVNGRMVGTAWKAPYRVDIGSAAKAGRNDLEVRVANLWVNRLIGDAQPGATKVTFTTVPTYRANAPLRPAGLLGPVELLQPAAAPR
jgi:hypothetical protein